MVQSQFFLTTLFVLDDECIVQPEIVNVLPVSAKLWPDAGAEIVLYRVIQDWAQLSQRELVCRNRVVRVGRERPRSFCCTNQSGTEFRGEATHCEDLGRDDPDRARVVDCIFVPEEALNITEGRIVVHGGHVVNVRILRRTMGGSPQMGAKATDNLKA